MSFLTPSAAWLAFLLIPLIILYFLKLKRPRLVVSSLVLWAQVMEDRRVNSPFQRFRKHLLLWLQIALLLLLVLAAMQPVLLGGGGAAQARVPVLVDVSASMAARAEPGGQTRLELVQERLYTRIANLKPGEELAIIPFADRAWLANGFSTNKRLLRQAVAELQVNDVAGDASQAIRLAAGLAQTSVVDEVWMLSDGTIPPDVDAELGVPLSYDLIDAASQNIGIVGARARLAGDGRWELLVSIGAASGTQAGADFVVEQDGHEIIRTPVTIEAGKTRRMLLRLPAGSRGLLSLSLSVQGFDALASDNSAWLQLPFSRPLRVHVDSSLPSWRAAADVFDGIVFVGPGEGADATITTQASAITNDTPLGVVVGGLPADLAALMTLGTGGASVADWVTTHPLLDHVALDELGIIDRVQWNRGRDTSDAENAGWRVLVHGREGPLLLASENEGQRRYVFPFHTKRSTLPYRVGFPILVANALTLLRSDLGLAEAGAVATGTISHKAGLPGSWTITGPTGAQQTVEATASGLITGFAAPQTGVYQIAQGAGEAQQVGAAVLSQRETLMQVSDSLAFNELQVGSEAVVDDDDRLLWPWLVVIAIFVLMAEWWVFQRRPGGW